VGPRASLDRCRKSCHHWGVNPRLCSLQQVAVLTQKIVSTVIVAIVTAVVMHVETLV